MSNLKLVTTENFGNLECNFYRNMNDDILLTREQIGQALEYANPAKAIQKIHLKHKDRLENLCFRMSEVRYPQNGGIGVNVETVYYTQRGIMEICRWSRQPLANKFMDWVWDIVEKYRSKEILDFTCVTHTLNQLMNVFQKYENQICKIEKQLAVQQKQLNRLTTHKKPYNPWFSKMSPKYKLLEEHFNITRGELYKEILMELKKTYGLDPNQIQVDYCYENNLDTCYPLEPYEFVPTYRKMIEEIIDKNLLKFGIMEDNQVLPCKEYKTIFDTPVEKKEK
ncbi:MAG: hypothetical protein DBY32_06895 [Phascolarctobacterium sp.]|nr:hypothetical protein HMPREF0490_00710 [Lachnospiraceae bacterium 6_1_37FAA]PWM77895.1 MAG: hypothetical protein DBY32_06895 [Phascolarctobacterium sp.]DAN96262.1 MAG TPA: hypothetical protein [Caudoviricetes sp.]